MAPPAFAGWIRLKNDPYHPTIGLIQLVPGWVAVRLERPGSYNPMDYPDGHGPWAVYPAEKVTEVTATLPTGTTPFGSDPDPETVDVPHVDLLIVSDAGPLLGPISCQTLAAAIAYGGIPVGPDGWTVQGDRCRVRISREGQASDE